MATAVVVACYNLPVACAFSICSTRPTYSISLRRTSYRCHALKMTDDDDDDSPADDTIIEGFGVGEKTLELRDLVEVDQEIDISVPQEDLIDPVPLQKDLNTTTIITKVPTLAPMTLLKFVAPTLALWIAPPVMSLIDTSVVGRFCGASDLAALSPGCTLIDSSAYLFMFIATAATNMIASSRAEKGSDETSERIVSEALFLALVSGIFLASMVFLLGGPLLYAIAGQESASVVPSALKYATVRAFGQPAVIMASVARASALAGKDTQGPLTSVALAFVLNAIGTVALVRFTNLGIVGAAIGTLCADCAATLFLLTRIKQSRRKDKEVLPADESLPEKDKIPLVVIPTMTNFRRFCQYAAPIFFTILGKSVVYNGVAMSVGRLGSVALAAHQVLLRR